MGRGKNRAGRPCTRARTRADMRARAGALVILRLLRSHLQSWRVSCRRAARSRGRRGRREVPARGAVY
eukprot:4702022-Pleurochrysis_carterae.AAC.1